MLLTSQHRGFAHAAPPAHPHACSRRATCPPTLCASACAHTAHSFLLDENQLHHDGSPRGIDIQQAHADFLAAYGLSPDDAPLLHFDPSNWRRPFSPLRAPAVEDAASKRVAEVNAQSPYR